MEKARFQLPAAEDDLWYQVVVQLLAQRNVSEWDARDRLRLLEELAFHYRFCGKILTLTFIEDTATWLAKEKDFGSPRDKAQGWLADLERWELLVRRGRERDTTYEFPIPTLDEYFAACHLAARWAEEDEKYRTWLPCSEGWWERSKTLHCPNPCCRATLPPFRELLRQTEDEGIFILRTECEETFLLMVGLLREAEREKVLLNDMRDDLNLKLKALSRCRHEHPDVGDHILESVLKGDWTFISRDDDSFTWTHGDGLAAIGRARMSCNLEHILSRCIRGLCRESSEAVSSYALILGMIGDLEAIDPLSAALTHDDFNVACAAAWALGEMGAVEAVDPLSAALIFEGGHVGATAAWALGEIGTARAADALIKALTPDTGVHNAISYALERARDPRAVAPLIAAALKIPKSQWCELVIAAAMRRGFCLWEGSVQIKTAAAGALGQIGDVRAIPTLQRLLGNPDRLVREVAQRALEEIERRTRSESRTDT